MSILIGINDCWHEFNCQNGVSAERFEMYYNLLIEEVKEALPDIKIMILEPFVLPGSATNNTEEIPDRWEYFERETALRCEVAKQQAPHSSWLHLSTALPVRHTSFALLFHALNTPRSVRYAFVRTPHFLQIMSLCVIGLPPMLAIPTFPWNRPAPSQTFISASQPQNGQGLSSISFPPSCQHRSWGSSTSHQFYKSALC